MMCAMARVANGEVRDAVPSAETRPRGEGMVLAAFVALVLIGGSNFVAVRFSNFSLPPVWAAGSRFATAAVILVLIGRTFGILFPRGRALIGASVYGLLTFGVFYALMYLALVDAPAALAAVVLASVPLITFLLAFAQRQERFQWRGILGGVIAVAGIAIIVGGPEVPLTSLLALGGAALAAGEGGVVAKRIPKTHPVTLNAVAMAAGSVLLLVLSALRGEPWVFPEDGAMWAVQIYLVTVGSVGLFVLYLIVLGRWTASRTAFAFVLFPIVAAALGAWLLDDPITLPLAIGSAVVLAGVYIGALRGALSSTSAESTREA